MTLDQDIATTVLSCEGRNPGIEFTASGLMKQICSEMGIHLPLFIRPFCHRYTDLFSSQTKPSKHQEIATSNRKCDKNKPRDLQEI